MTIDELKGRLAELTESAQAIQATADAAKRDLNEEEAKNIDQILDVDIPACEADIARRSRLETVTARVDDTTPAPRKTRSAQVDIENSARSTVPATPRDPRERARDGWHTFGDFCAAVRSHVMNPGAQTDPRLIKAALSTYGQESVGADGGFAVPPEWRDQIMQMVYAEDSILSRTDQQQASGNSITFPLDETTQWQTSGGIQAYWDGEASTISQSKIALKEVTAKLHRLTALVPVTDELLEDSTAMGSYVSRKAGEKIDFKVTDAIINGTGAGQPLGIMNAACRVSVLKETNQVAATFHANNAVKMMARLQARSFSRSVWLINQDVVPQILRLGFVITDPAGTTAGGAGALYMPPTGLPNSSSYGSLLGRPIIVTEACQAVGTVGDVILADLTQYLSVVKAGGLKTDVSMHLFFDQNATAFRFVLRMNGQPWLSAPIARKNGSNTLTHFVTVDTRT